ncbi:hypothetical protein [Sphingomonas radiodurans]|uniref:hypothetical protein n=1 Tax=Sphingomonas radiodurans TaxID=2890321 RepID=UPI001E45C690|nr:hypothetical protein [Sphingomonas radiodurans]WBH16705.1 hypothetical protein LLW23_00840 [Sphingomonas radiodurans]
MASKPSFGGSLSIQSLIDREIGCNPELKNGASAYVSIIAEFAASKDSALFLERLLDQAGSTYRAAGQSGAQLYTFSDRGVSFLFDMVRQRAVLIWATSRLVPANSRDNNYHAGYPSAGTNRDKGHAISHAQGGFEGGPNYFPQARRLNQSRSANGKLWRAIERHFSANPGESAFVRLIYASGNDGDVPDEVEYLLLPMTGQYRAVIFPNS